MASESRRTGKQDRGAGVRGMGETAKARGGKTIGTPKRGAAAAQAGAGRGPGGTGVDRRSAAKMVGGGLAAGSTDFGQGHSPSAGGRGRSRGGTSTRSSEVGGATPTAGGGGAASGGMNPAGTGGSMAGAAGNSVLATGRRTRDDSRQAIGSADRPDVEDAMTARGGRKSAGHQPGRAPARRGAAKTSGAQGMTGARPGQDTSKGGGQTGAVTASPESLGSEAIAVVPGSAPSGTRRRSGDITDDGGRGNRNDPGPNLAPARGGTADVETPTADAGGGWKRATKSAREGTARRGKPASR